MCVNRKLFACLLAGIILLTGCGNDDDDEIISDYIAFEYMLKLQDYVEQTGDADIYYYLLEGIDSDYLADYMCDREGGYLDGWNACYDEIVEKREESYRDGYYDGVIDGYAEGYADGSTDVPYKEEMIRPSYKDYFPKE